MKKILTLALSLIVILSLCACGSTSIEKDDDEPKNTPTFSNDPTDGNDSTDSTDAPDSPDSGTQETGYIGSWKVIPPDDNPFPPITLVINADGTAIWNKETKFWYESPNPNAKEGSIQIAREDNMGYGNDAYIMDDGTLYLDINMTVGDNSYDHLIFERQ